MRISFIAAVSENDVLGNRGQIPWRLPADFERMHRVIRGAPLIMGRKTHESIGRVLPGHRTIVVTRGHLTFPGTETAASVEEALQKALEGKAEEVFIFGGGEVYRAALPYAHRIHLTRVHAVIEGDAYFPKIDPSEWRELSREPHEADEKNPLPYTFLVYERIGEAKEYVARTKH